MKTIRKFFLVWTALIAGRCFKKLISTEAYSAEDFLQLLANENIVLISKLSNHESEKMTNDLREHDREIFMRRMKLAKTASTWYEIKITKKRYMIVKDLVLCSLDVEHSTWFREREEKPMISLCQYQWIEE